MKLSVSVAFAGAPPLERDGLQEALSRLVVGAHSFEGTLHGELGLAAPLAPVRAPPTFPLPQHGHWAGRDTGSVLGGVHGGGCFCFFCSFNSDAGKKNWSP